MPFGLGLKYRIQYYDQNTSEYDDEYKNNLLESDKEKLVMFYYFGLDYDLIKFHFPNYLIHDSEYCEIFCRTIRNEVFIKEFNLEKCKYLLTHLQKKDKSKFFNLLGYNMENIKKFQNDIVAGTDFDSVCFLSIDNWGLRIKTKTIIQSKILSSIWVVEKDLGLKFITLIPGGDKK